MEAGSMFLKYEIVNAEREWSSRLEVERGFVFP
jgi:hypothetical protein